MHYQFGSFNFDVQNARLSGPDGDIALRPMTLRLLQELLQAAPQLVSHDSLLDRVWGRQEVTQGVLSQSIRELRRALDDSAQDSRFIETRHKLGYCFIAPVEIRSDDESAEPKAAAPAAGGNTGDPRAPLLPSGFDPSAAPTASAQAIPSNLAPAKRSRPSLPMILVLLSAVLLAIWQLRVPQRSPAENPFIDVEVLRDNGPHEPQARQWYREGLTALQAQDYSLAQERLTLALRREPTSVAVKAALAEALVPMGQRERGLALARSALAESRSLPRAEQLRVSSFLAGLEYRRADQITELTALFGLDPGDVEAGMRLAKAQIGAGRSRDAQATVQRIEALDPALVDRARLALLRARLAAVRGDHQQRALEAAEAEKVARSPQVRLDALFERAWAQLFAGQTEDARASLELIDHRVANSTWPATKMRRDMLAATLMREAANFEGAIEQFDAARLTAEGQGNRLAAAAAQREAAFVLVLAGKHAEAEQRLQPLLAEHEALGDPRELASTLDVLALTHQRSGRVDSAQAMGERALRAYVAAEDRIGEAGVRNNQGMLLARSGRFDDAQQQWEQALALFESRGDLRGAAVVLSNLSGVYLRQGRQQAARDATERALATFRKIDAVAEISRLQFNLALQDRRNGDLAASEARMREALQGFTSTQAEDSRLQTVASLAELLLARADPSAAETILEAVTLDAATAPQRASAIISARGRLAALRGDPQRAASEFNNALQQRQSAKLDDWALMSELDLAELAARSGRLAEGEHTARQVRREMLERGDALAAIQSGLLLAGIQHAQQRAQDAARLLEQLETELAQHPDAMLTQRLDLITAATHATGKVEALGQVASSARAMGFELLALRAEVLADDANAVVARAALAERGIPADEPPSPLAY